MSERVMVDAEVYKEVILNCLVAVGYSAAHAEYVLHAATETDLKESELWAVRAIEKAARRAAKLEKQDFVV